MIAINTPSWLKTDATKRKEMLSFLKANAKDSRPENWNTGARVLVLEGHHDKKSEIINDHTTEFVAATIDSFDEGYVRVTFDSGSDWGLSRAGKIVDLKFFDDYMQLNDVPLVLDTSHLDKLVLEPESKQEIVNVIKQHHNFAKIFEEWGLAEVMEYGRAMSLLFYGPPGTGKTWAANCIAKALGKELLVISAAEIQTSEPGGANRNILQAFAQAKADRSVLFLDECDGLITDRAHVGMILASEINTLLTALEQFEGVVIFATNRADTLDPAMARRISLMLEFKEPTEAQRVDIWKVLLPTKLPLASDVSIAKLAKFELTGGYVKNVILSAARAAAAAEATEVHMKHFASAIKRIRDTKDVIGTHTSRKEDYVKARS